MKILPREKILILVKVKFVLVLTNMDKATTMTAIIWAEEITPISFTQKRRRSDYTYLGKKISLSKNPYQTNNTKFVSNDSKLYIS